MRSFGAAVLIALVPGVALGADLPPRKSGLWEIKMAFEGRPGAQAFQQCVDPETDAIMQSSATNIGSQCSKRDVVKSGDTITIDSVCSVAGKEASSHAVVKGSFDSGYTMTVSSKSDAAAINLTVTGKWLGPCEAGQRPGDLILPNGIKLNLKDMGKSLPVPGGAPPMPR
jgi:Protein of unknown function (DUF3617)